MSEPLREMPDASKAVRDLIDFWFGADVPANPQAGAAAHAEPALAAPASVDSPTTGEDPLPWAQAYVFGGGGGQVESDFTADVAFFAPTYGAASLLARRFEARFMGYPHRVSSNGRSVLFDSVEQISVPAEVPWGVEGVRRFQATYSFSIRR
jgi:hypothetical protein